MMVSEQSSMKAGEDNPQAREEEGKLPHVKFGEIFPGEQSFAGGRL